MRFSLATAAAALLPLLSPALPAQRLPGGVVPTHYDLHLPPDLQAAPFTGEETIDLQLQHPGAAITLNAAEITFVSVTGASPNTDARNPQTAAGSLHPPPPRTSCRPVRSPSTSATPAS